MIDIGLSYIRASLLLCVALVALSGCSTTSEQLSKKQSIAADYRNAGVQALMKRKRADAIHSFRKALIIYPEDHETLNYLGLAYAQKNKLKLAEQSIQKAIKLKPDYSDARNNLAVVYIRQKKFAQAEHELNKILADLEYNNQHQTYFNLGIVYFKRGNFRVAQDYFKKASIENPHYCVNWMRLADASWELKDIELSTVALKKASTELCYSYVEAHYRLGMMFVKLKNFDFARIKFREILENFPKSRWAIQANEKLSLLNKNK